MVLNMTRPVILKIDLSQTLHQLHHWGSGNNWLLSGRIIFLWPKFCSSSYFLCKKSDFFSENCWNCTFLGMHYIKSNALCPLNTINMHFIDETSKYFGGVYGEFVTDLCYSECSNYKPPAKIFMATFFPDGVTKPFQEAVSRSTQFLKYKFVSGLLCRPWLWCKITFWNSLRNAG